MEMNHNYPMNRGYHGLPNQLKIAHICLPGLGDSSGYRSGVNRPWGIPGSERDDLH